MNTGPHPSSRRSIDPLNMEEGGLVGRGEGERILALRATNLTLPPSQKRIKDPLGLLTVHDVLVTCSASRFEVWMDGSRPL